MTTKRLKQLAALVPTSDEELRTLILRTIVLQTDRENAVALRDAKLAEMQQSIENKYGYTKFIAETDLDLARNAELIEAWAETNRARFGDKKSLDLAGARIGWRSIGWRTALISRITWDRVCEYLRGLVTAGEAAARAPAAEQDEKTLRDGLLAAQFLRIKVAPDKEAMIAKRDDAEATELLHTAGVMIESEDKFFIEPDREGQQEATIKS